jgi:hypothetical protein
LNYIVARYSVNVSTGDATAIGNDIFTTGEALA